MYDIAIIGGGASGLACAVAALECAAATARPIPRIVILEATDKIGRPILRSGNGRCNFSNAHIFPDAYNDPETVADALASLEQGAVRAGIVREAPNPVVGFFEGLGLIWRQESEGRLYPLANKASVVLDVLRSPLLRFGVDVRCEAKVAKVVPSAGKARHHTIHLEGGELVRAHDAVIAAGGASGAFGLDACLPYAQPRPVLGPLATDDRFTRPLDNIRVRCAVHLMRDGAAIAEERGEVQFRKYGVSGIAVFNLSRLAQAADVLRIDLIPDAAPGIMADRLALLGRSLAKDPSNFELLQGMVLPLVADQVLKSAGLEGAHQATEQSAALLEEHLHGFDLRVKGIGDAELCQVSRGGFDPCAFDLSCMQSKEHPGLYVIGEALDVDGACGGFNLHWAFATGLLAAWRIVGVDGAPSC